MGGALGASATIRPNMWIETILVFQLEINSICLIHLLYCDVHVYVCDIRGMFIYMHTSFYVYQLKLGNVHSPIKITGSPISSCRFCYYCLEQEKYPIQLIVQSTTNTVKILRAANLNGSICSLAIKLTIQLFHWSF